MRQLSFFALLQLLLASTIHALQPSSTLSGTRQKALLSLSQWKTALHARRPPPEYWEEEEDLDFRRRPPYSEPRNQAPMQYSEEEEEGGNYWSNPPARYDPVQSRGDRVPRPDEPPRMRRNQQQQQGPPPPRRGRRLVSAVFTGHEIPFCVAIVYCAFSDILLTDCECLTNLLVFIFAFLLYQKIHLSIWHTCATARDWRFLQSIVLVWN